MIYLSKEVKKAFEIFNGCPANFVVAGGVFTSMLSDTKFGDIDIFFNTKKDFILAYDFFSKFKIINSTNQTVSFKNDGLTYQMIPRYSFNGDYNFATPQDLIKSFDFDCCKIATDGINFYTENNSIEKAKNKIISFDPCKAPPKNTLLRIIKYKKKGFSLESENDFDTLLFRFLENPTKENDFYEME